MKKSKVGSRILVLQRQTIRELAPEALSHAAGGNTVSPSEVDRCPSMACPNLGH